MPTLPSLAAPQVVIMTTYGATSDDKTGIKTSLIFHHPRQLIWPGVSLWHKFPKDTFSVSLQSPNCRHLSAVKGSARGLSVASENRQKFPSVMWLHNASHVRSSQYIFGLSNHAACNTANWRPCLISHRQSYCHQAKTVKQSINFSCWLRCWTHCGLNKMTDILQTTFSKALKSWENVCISIQISMTFISKGPIGNASVLVRKYLCAKQDTNLTRTNGHQDIWHFMTSLGHKELNYWPGKVSCWSVWRYNDVIMGMIASQITSLTIVYSIVYSDADQRKHQNSTSLAFVRGIHRGPVNSPYKWPVTRKMFPFDDVIMVT